MANNQGVCPHSTNLSSPLVIFCVGPSPMRNAEFLSWAADRGLGVKEVVGCYKGEMERAFVMFADDFDAHVRPWVREEERVLRLGMPVRRAGDRPASLHYSDGRVEELPNFRQVSPSQALSEDAWTFDPMTGVYFACTPRPAGT